MHGFENSKAELSSLLIAPLEVLISTPQRSEDDALCSWDFWIFHTQQEPLERTSTLHAISKTLVFGYFWKKSSPWMLEVT
jgi:hypothetical protein